MARDGGEMTRLTHGAGFDVEPVWSSDEKQIAFISGSSFGAGVLTVIDAQSGQKLPLPQELAAMDKLHFDRANRRVLGLFQPATEKMRLAWFDLEIGRIDQCSSLGIVAGPPARRLRDRCDSGSLCRTITSHWPSPPRPTSPMNRRGIAVRGANCGGCLVGPMENRKSSSAGRRGFTTSAGAPMTGPCSSPPNAGVFIRTCGKSQSRRGMRPRAS